MPCCSRDVLIARAPEILLWAEQANSARLQFRSRARQGQYGPVFWELWNRLGWYTRYLSHLLREATLRPVSDFESPWPEILSFKAHTNTLVTITSKQWLCPPTKQLAWHSHGCMVPYLAWEPGVRCQSGTKVGGSVELPNNAMSPCTCLTVASLVLQDLGYPAKHLQLFKGSDRVEDQHGHYRAW